MAKSKFEQSLEDGAHKKIKSTLGSWKGTSKVWLEKGILSDESESEAIITSILGDRFISIDYTGFMAGKPLEGKMIVGFDIPYQKFTSSWIDSYHMGTQILISTGDANENGFWMLGSWGNPEYGDDLWGWRTEFDISKADTLTITAFIITPGGEEAKATEVVYKRI